MTAQHQTQRQPLTMHTGAPGLLHQLHLNWHLRLAQNKYRNHMLRARSHRATALHLTQVPQTLTRDQHKTFWSMMHSLMQRLLQHMWPLLPRTLHHPSMGLSHRPLQLWSHLLLLPLPLVSAPRHRQQTWLHRQTNMMLMTLLLKGQELRQLLM